MDEEQPRFNASKFPRVTKQALEFYQKGASEEEKKVVADTIREAAKTIKKDLRGGQQGGKGKKNKKGRRQPSPEQLAAGLYKVLSETGTAKVHGDPKSGEQTQIQGQVDLNEVARKLLSLAP